jgi:hypothetical protein
MLNAIGWFLLISIGVLPLFALRRTWRELHSATRDEEPEPTQNHIYTTPPRLPKPLRDQMAHDMAVIRRQMNTRK